MIYNLMYAHREAYQSHEAHRKDYDGLNECTNTNI